MENKNKAKAKYTKLPSASESIVPPKKLDEHDKQTLEQVMKKYDLPSVIPIIESLIQEGRPVTGFRDEVDEDYFLRKFIQIGNTAYKPYDRIKAFESAARMLGYFDNGNKQMQGVSIQFNVRKPADSEQIDREFPLRES